MKIDYDNLEIEITDGGIHEFFLDGEKFTGIACEYDNNGAILSEISFKDGLESGITRTWYPQGLPESETSYLLGQKHGQSKEWYEDRKLKSNNRFWLGALLIKKQYDKEGNQVEYYNVKEHPLAYETFKRTYQIFKNKL
jgi:antitoxin component YwqK of YwqJK toxin-antitoxin module